MIDHTALSGANTAHLNQISGLAGGLDGTTTAGNAGAVTRPGLNGFAGREVAVGGGEQSAEARGAVEKVKSGLARFGQLIQGCLALGPAAAATVLHGIAWVGTKIGEKVTGVTIQERAARQDIAAESRQILANFAMYQALQKPQGPSLTNNPAVTQKLEAHAAATGKLMTQSEIRRNVVMGENILKALAASPDGKPPLTMSVDGKPVTIESNMLTFRAVCWYQMAAAAANDVRRDAIGTPDATSHSDMVTSGIIKFKDPGNKLIEFLRCNPEMGTRLASHEEQNAGNNRDHKLLGILPTMGAKPEQYGIEDYQSRLPGKGGAACFNSLRPGADGVPLAYIKFESVGMPPLFVSGSRNQHLTAENHVTRYFAAVDRSVHHSFNFLNSRTHTDSGENAVVRQEHVKKGVLKEIVYEPMQELAQRATRFGLMDQDAASAVKTSMKKLGMPAVWQMLDHIETEAGRRNLLALEQDAKSLRQSIGAEMNRLGFVSDNLGVQRSGAEVHISINPHEVIANLPGMPA